MPDTLKEASWGDVISAAARANGVNPALALAVAQQESGLDPAAKSAKGALGIMQLMPATAAELGVDPADPVQNIQGGIKYLKQLSDKYQGDLEKTLHAYNAGPGTVDAGQPLPAETTAYASAVLSKLARGTKTPAPVTPAVTPAAVTPAPAVAPPAAAGAPPKQSFVRQLVESVNPLTPAGRRGLGGTIGGVVGGAAGAPGAAVGAAAGGIAAEGANTVLAHAEELPGAVVDVVRNLFSQPAATVQGFKEGAHQAAQDVGLTGAAQAAYELGGRAIIWPFARIGKSLVATRVGRAASDALTSRISAASEAAKSGIRGATETADEALASTRESMSSFVNSVKTRASAAVTAAKDRTAKVVGSTVKGNEDALAQAELDAAHDVAGATKVYEDLAAKAPSQAAVKDSTQKVLGGLPGVGNPSATGPSKRALDAAGRKIEAAAQTGPAVSLKPVQQALDEMQEKARPASLFPSKTDKDITNLVGFVPKVVSSEGKIAAKAGVAGTEDRAILESKIRQALGVDNSHPLPGILAQVQQAPESVTFAEAHQLKRLLDESVTWDRTAKRHLEQLTKGVRTTLRKVLATHEPYNEATRGYADLVPIYRKGAGKALVKAAGERPDRIAKLLKPNAPHDAEQIRRLLVDQSAAGGDEAAGQEAWDHVRSAFTYDNIVSGGPKGLSDRIAKLETEHPEFMATVFGDDSAKAILSNLKQIGSAYQQAVARGTEKVASTKATGKALVSSAEGIGAAGERQAADTGAASVTSARQKRIEAIRQRRRAGKQDVQAAIDAGQALRKGAKGARDAFMDSSMGPYASKSMQSQVADLARASGVGSGIVGSVNALVRIFGSPKGSELLAAAAYSPEMTQRLVKVLVNPSVPANVVANMLRDLGSMVAGPPPEQKP